VLDNVLLLAELAKLPLMDEPFGAARDRRYVSVR
jgi:hypothetical protein